MPTPWLKNRNTAEANHLGESLVELCKVYPENEDAQFVVKNADLLPRPSMWIFGGDGWAYDIGYGGLDHILASRENFNVLVFDTEVYSNIRRAVLQGNPHRRGGSVCRRRQAHRQEGILAQIAMTNGHVYVAQVAMGANPAQTLRALKEAESYDGPSLIIAYAPAITTA